MKSKRWIALMLLLVFLGMGCYMGLNYYANPLGYFTNEKGLTYNFTDDYGRSIKARYLLAHTDDIDAIVMGGSKAGAINTALLTEYTGLRYYNLYFNMGNFADYLRFTRFLAEKTKVREITLHLSSYEVLSYDRTYRGNAYKVPAALSSNPAKKAIEFLSYLMTDPRTLKNALTKRAKKKITAADDLTTGMKNWIGYVNALKKDADKAVAKNVINRHDERMRLLLAENDNDSDPDEMEARIKGIEALRQIRQICEEHGITLKVMIGASFLDERYTYECDAYYDYLRQIVEVCGQVWDFSDFCDVNRNPYNFNNEKHFTYALADLMVETMYGKNSLEGFGTLLTEENILPYLSKRRQAMASLREEYASTGTVSLLDRSDPSYVSLESYGY